MKKNNEFQTIIQYELCTIDEKGCLLAGIQKSDSTDIFDRILNEPYDTEEEAIIDFQKHFPKESPAFFIFKTIKNVKISD